MDINRLRKDIEDVQALLENGEVEKAEIQLDLILLDVKAAEQSVQPTVLTHWPNCAGVQSLVADCNCGLAKSHSG